MAVLTGAGVSAESGVPTFRDAQTGLWAKFSPEELAFQQEVRSLSEFPYNSIYPLVAAPLPDTGGLNVMMVFYADRIRWDAPKEVAGPR